MADAVYGTTAEHGASVTFWGEVSSVYEDLCRWRGTERQLAPRASAGALAQALMPLAGGRDAEAVVLGGRDALTLRLDPAVAPEEGCDEGTLRGWNAAQSDGRPWHGPNPPPDGIVDAWIISVNGRGFLLHSVHSPGAPDSLMAELHGVLNSIDFEPFTEVR